MTSLETLVFLRQQTTDKTPSGTLGQGISRQQVKTSDGVRLLKYEGLANCIDSSLAQPKVHGMTLV